MLGFQGDERAAVTHFRLVGTLGGIPMEQEMWQAVRARDGKLTWWATLRTEREALQAVGLA